MAAYQQPRRPRKAARARCTRAPRCRRPRAVPNRRAGSRSSTQATPWPYNVLVHVAAWAGLRAAELGGLLVGDVDLAHAPPWRLPTGGAHASSRLTARLRTSRPRPRAAAAGCRLPPRPRTCCATTWRPTRGAADPTAPLFPAIRLGPSGSRLGTQTATPPCRWPK